MSSLRERSWDGVMCVVLNQEISEASTRGPKHSTPKGTQQAKNNEATPEGETEELGRSGSGLPSAWIINPLLPVKMWKQVHLASQHCG